MKLRKKLTLTTVLASSLALMMITLTAEALGLNQETMMGGIGPDAGRYLAAGLAVGLAGFGSSIGMGSASAAAIGALSENEDLFGSVLIFVVLIEAVAIYGLLIALLLIFAV